jgi:lipoprotein NlpD
VRSIDSSPYASRSKPQPAPVRSKGYYVVRPGDTLYSIAWRYGVDHRRLADWNGVPYPYTIYPSQRLQVVKPTVKTKVAVAPTPKKKSTPPATPVKPKSQPKTVKKTTPQAIRKKSVKTGVKLRWQWPTKGTVVQGYSAKDPSRKGIKIAGVAGEAVQAAEAGTVVYSGTGLIGYGQLVIVKHNSDYLSAYGHNRRLLVKEGDRVKRGMRIAELGTNGDGKARLHFEIRYNGNPVNPVSLLPSRR